MSAETPNLPAEVLALIGGAPRTRVTASGSGAFVERVDSRPALFVKSSSSENGTAAREAARLRWLAEAAEGEWFPRVVLEVCAGGWQHLVTTACEGVGLFEWATHHGAEQAIAVLVEAHERVGRLPAGTCPFRLDTSWLLDMARESVDAGIDARWIEKNEPGSSALDLLAEAERLCPLTPAAPAVVHGDFYPGNIVVDANGTWALVDWPWAGVGDRHRDVSKAVATVRLEWGQRWADQLLGALRAPIDERTLRGFTALHPLL